MGSALAALVGLILGSFIATLVLRGPAGRSVLGRSQCDACGRPLGVPDLIPLLSALAARGRCRTCDAPIDRFHSRVEAGSALIGALALALMPGTAGWLWALDRKSTRLTPVTNEHIVCRLLLEKKKKT